MAQSILEEAKNIVEKSTIIKNNGKKARITTNQLRKFLAEVVRISNMIEVHKAHKNTEMTEELKTAIEFLEVKLMYQVGRDKLGNKLIKEFYEAGDFSNRIKKASQSFEDYEHFANVMEAVVAIFKYEGERN